SELVVHADGVAASEIVGNGTQPHTGTAYAGTRRDDGITIEQVLDVGEYLQVFIGAEATGDPGIHVERRRQAVVVNGTDVGTTGRQHGIGSPGAERYRHVAFQTRAV